MRAFGPRISAYAFWTTTDIHTDINISREISIEHPSVGLASLAQLETYVRMYTYIYENLDLDDKGGGGGGLASLDRLKSELGSFPIVFHPA